MLDICVIVIRVTSRKIFPRLVATFVESASPDRGNRSETHERGWFKVRVNDGASNGGGVGSRDYGKNAAAAVYDISPHWARRKLLSAVKPPRFLRFLYDGSGVYASLERTFVRTTNVADVTLANDTSTLAEKSQRDIFFLFFAENKRGVQSKIDWP